MRLLVCGSRGWVAIADPMREIAALSPSVLIHGAAGQRDPVTGEPTSSDILFAEIAVRWAESCGRQLIVESFPADWEHDGRAAGPIRNARMLRNGRPDRGLAFGELWRRSGSPGAERSVGAKLWKPTGTGDMVSRLLRACLPVWWVSAPGAVGIDLVGMPSSGEVQP